MANTERATAIAKAKDLYFLATRRAIYNTKDGSIYALQHVAPGTNPRTAWRATIGLSWTVELSANGGTVKAWQQ